MPVTQTLIAVFNFAQRTATTTELALTIAGAYANQNTPELAVKTKNAQWTALSTENVYVVNVTVPQDGLVKVALSPPAQMHATPEENAYKVHANANLDGVGKPAKNKNAPTNVRRRQTANVTLKLSSALAKKDGPEKTAAKKLAQKTATAMVGAKTAFACATTSGLVNLANSQLARTLAVATECALEISASVTLNIKETIAVSANAQMLALETENAWKRRSPADVALDSQAKTVGSKHAPRTVMLLTASANLPSEQVAKRLASAYALTAGLAHHAQTRDARKSANTASAWTVNASATVDSWETTVLSQVAQTTAMTMVYATLRRELLFASAR